VYNVVVKNFTFAISLVPVVSRLVVLGHYYCTTCYLARPSQRELSAVLLHMTLFLLLGPAVCHGLSVVLTSHSDKLTAAAHTHTHTQSATGLTYCNSLHGSYLEWPNVHDC